MRKAVYLFVAGFLFFPFLGLSQKENLSNTLGFGLDAGITTFFGDVDDAPAHSDYTNNFAFRASVNKNLWYWLALEGHVLAGNLSGEKKRGSGEVANYIYFTSKFVEFSLNAEISAVSLFTKKTNSLFDIIPFGGIGIVRFKSNLYNGINDALIDSYGYESEESAPEIAMLLGVKLTYKISDHFHIVGQTSNRVVNTDMLDSKKGQDKWDIFNYTAIGVSYRIFLGGTDAQNKFRGFEDYKNRKSKKNSTSKCPAFK